MVKMVNVLVGLWMIIGAAEALRAGKTTEDGSGQERQLQGESDLPFNLNNENPFGGQCGLTLGATDEACAALAVGTAEVCDCYTFCNGELISCLDFGESSAFKCAGDVVAGCTGPIMTGDPDDDMPIDIVTNTTNTTLLD